MFGSRRSKPKSRPIVFGLAALACFFVFDRVAAYGLQWLLLRSDDRIAKIYAGGRTDDILILGSSVANAMALPGDLGAATGTHVYTMAVHGLDAITQLALVRDYLTLNDAPKIAVLEIRAVRTNRIWAPELELFAGQGSHLAEVNRVRRTSLFSWPDIFHLYKFNSPELPKALQNIFDRDDQETGPSNGRITPAIAASWKLRAGTVLLAPPDQLAALVATIKAFQDVGTRPILVVAPLHPLALYQAPQLIREVSPILPSGVAMYDFSTALSEDRYFEDPLHLNGEGRRAFRPVLAAAIKEDLGKQAKAPAVSENRVGSAGIDRRIALP
jgi:hypothetical protein